MGAGTGIFREDGKVRSDRKASVLIVEDSFIVAYHLKLTLESEGYHVLATLDSGEAALQLIATTCPDLVLMDIMLNGSIDGVETARIVKSEYNLPVIYITALSDRETVQRAKITEPYGFLTKPFADREIFTVIEMALYKHRIETRLRQSEEKYYSTLRSISDAVILIDSTFEITYANPAAEKLIGSSSMALLHGPLLDVLKLRNVESDDYPVNPLQCELGDARLNMIPRNLVLTGRDGDEIPVGDGSLSPVIDSKGNCTGLVLIFKDLTNKIEHERLLQRLESERLAALHEGQEKERTRIARDLHDGLGQILTAVKMQVSLSRQGHSSDYLNRLIDEAISETVRISENLLPSSLNDFDLSTCLERLCSQINIATNLPVSFEQLGETSLLDRLQKINLFRIAQEGINNAVKHANASHIHVQLTQTEENTLLTIEDNGVGIMNSPGMNSFRHGLANMRERAEMMGGKLIIESDKNRGTLLIAEAPLRQKNTL